MVLANPIYFPCVLSWPCVLSLVRCDGVLRGSTLNSDPSESMTEASTLTLGCRYFSFLVLFPCVLSSILSTQTRVIVSQPMPGATALSAIKTCLPWCAGGRSDCLVRVQNLFALMNIKKELWDEDVFQAKVLGMKVRRFFHSLQLTYLISTSSMHQDPVLKYCTSSFHQPCLFRPKSSGTKKQCHMAKLTSWFGHTALSNAHQWLLCLVLCFCSCITFLFGNSCKHSCKKLTYSRPTFLQQESNSLRFQCLLCSCFDA
jgi:hypothetical protein